MRKQFFQLLKITPLLCSAFVFCLFQGAKHHDSGIPSIVTPQQTEECIQDFDEWQATMRQICKTLDLFIDKPEEQTEMIERILDDFEIYQEVGDRMFSRPEYFSPSLKLPDETLLSVEKMNAVYKSTAERFAAEISRRVDSGEYDANRDDFIRLENELVAMEWLNEDRDFCDTEQCFWCKCRKYWDMN